MSKLRRYPLLGRPTFLTAVTFERKPILVDNFQHLWASLKESENRCSGALIAWVILPDHLHLLTECGEDSASLFVKRFKLIFTAKLKKFLDYSDLSLWQRRYWDHIIRDENDLSRHLDYIHYNPVKHGMTASPFQWPYSSIHEDSFQGRYAKNWGEKGDLNFDSNFGE